MARRVGRPRKRGLRKGTPGARISGAKRTKVGKSLTKHGVSFEVGTKGLKVSRQAQRVYKRKAGRRRKRGVKGKTYGARVGGLKRSLQSKTGVKAIGWKTPTPLSPHHKAQLLFPSRPFGARTQLIRKLQGGYISTAIYKFEYLPAHKVLIVQFWKIRIRKKKIVSRQPGGIYAYYGVSNRRYMNFVNASSKGRYFYYNIRGWFRFKRLS